MTPLEQAVLRAILSLALRFALYAFIIYAAGRVIIGLIRRAASAWDAFSNWRLGRALAMYNKDYKAWLDDPSSTKGDPPRQRDYQSYF